MNQNPALTVIIPVYNVEPYLAEALDCIVGQSFSDMEILCVNDGSTDGSPEILAEYAAADPRIRIIDQENQGLSAARNRGLDEARGEYVYYFDSDDLLDTVNMFFEKDLNLSDTARQLYIHRNTLTYRLDKIEKIIGLDLRRFEDAVTFKMLLEMKKCIR